MVLSASEKLKIKKHFNLLPTTSIVDSCFDVVDAEADILTLAQTQITTCDTRFTALETAIGAAGKVTSGFGAKLDEDIPISKKRELYINAVNELARLVQFPRNPFDWETSGSSVTGWFGG